MTAILSAPSALNIIALCGYKGSGKTTLAKLLSDRYGYFPVPFADPLKKMIHLLLREQGVDLNTADRMVYGDLKEVPTPFLAGRSPRYAQQTLGTEWGRDLIDVDIWTNIWENRVRHLAESTGHVKFVVDDLRFLSEQTRCKKLGGSIVRIDRRGVELSSQHQSEQEIDLLFPHFAIINDGKPEDMLDVLEVMLHIEESFSQ